MSGPWTYDLSVITYSTGAVEQDAVLTQVVGGEAATISAPLEYDLAVLTAVSSGIAQDIVLTQTVSGEAVTISGPWEYDIAALTSIRSGAVSQSLALTQTVDGTNWLRVGEIGPDVTTYADYTAHGGVTYEYRITSVDGAVLGTWVTTNTATLPVERDGVVAQNLTLSQSIAGVVAISGRVAQNITLTQTVAAGPVALIVDGAVAHALTLTTSVSGRRAFVEAAVVTPIVLAQSVEGVSAQGVPLVYGSVIVPIALGQTVSGRLYDPVTDAIRRRISVTPAIARASVTATISRNRVTSRTGD